MNSLTKPEVALLSRCDVRTVAHREIVAAADVMVAHALAMRGLLKSDDEGYRITTAGGFALSGVR